ncbi:MAG: site-2 protease family protein [Clostridia bacterium]
MRLFELFSNPRGFLMDMLYLLPAVIIALSFHEWAHAYAAYRLGDPTARNLGRMSVNPMCHLDPFGLIMLFLVGFGWAKPVPINPRNFKKPRRDEIIVSLAGVTANILLAFVFMGLYYLINLGFGFSNAVVNTIVMYIVQINIALFIFNLLPVPPLDGYRVVQCLLIRKVSPNVFYYAEKYGYLILIVLLMSGVFSGVLNAGLNGIMSAMSMVYTSIISLFV